MASDNESYTKISAPLASVFCSPKPRSRRVFRTALKSREDREEKRERPQAIGLLDGHKIRVGGVDKRAIVEQVLRRQSEGEEP